MGSAVSSCIVSNAWVNTWAKLGRLQGQCVQGLNVYMSKAQRLQQQCVHSLSAYLRKAAATGGAVCTRVRLQLHVEMFT